MRSESDASLLKLFSLLNLKQTKTSKLCCRICCCFLCSVTACKLQNRHSSLELCLCSSFAERVCYGMQHDVIPTRRKYHAGVRHEISFALSIYSLEQQGEGFVSLVCWLVVGSLKSIIAEVSKFEPKIHFYQANTPPDKTRQTEWEGGWLERNICNIFTSLPTSIPKIEVLL